jgi:NAD(P)-dependent dehydrogenase (short-subunit alcohol dehydrogenase family)
LWSCRKANKPTTIHFRRSTIKDFNNKTVLITGGAGGIGIGMAKAFGERGANLVLVDLDAARLQLAADQLRYSSPAVLTCIADTTDITSLKTAVQQSVERFGGINVLCANAGVTGFLGPLHEGTEQDWNWIIDVNVKGTVNTVQAALPLLLQNQHDAHIVLTASISGLRVHDPSRGQGMYNTTKFAVVGFAEALSLDLAPYGIGVSVLCPGVVNTDFSNAGKYRQAKYGGPHAGNKDDFVLAKASAAGTDPLTFGRWVIRAVERNQLFVVTHTQDRDQVAARHDRIMAAFDAALTLTSGTESPEGM